MGRMGQFFQGLDDRIANQAEERANNARMRAIDGIEADMRANATDPAVLQQVGGYAPAGGNYLDAAIAQREGYSAMQTPIESINRAMNDSAAARYGVVGGAAVGGGLALTAGAQKLIGLMDMLNEANQTEVARDMPLQS